MDKDRLQEYAYDDYKVVTNFETYDDAEQYARETGGEMIEVGFTDGSDNPMPNDTAKLMETRKPFRVGLDPLYEVIYSEDERFQEMAQNILEDMKEKENDVAPEDWIADQNIATGDRIIVLRDGEVNTVTTRERIKFLMRGNLYEIGVKVPN
ncbi:hypothetical protein EIH07_09295 [Chryseobacterium taklimakanense]|uniref:hypothetical protein n=1 Tax=Chryseobacterium taklimakanense TaxID=536441 RepID=UPI000F5FF0E1|nr:hypothetical protein [Chryseobacterium taklimakanense]AZI23221.1 hypothetical protein EIH07_09295 [Chryseobacterium taklimakanense]